MTLAHSKPIHNLRSVILGLSIVILGLSIAILDLSITILDLSIALLKAGTTIPGLETRILKENYSAPSRVSFPRALGLVPGET